MQKPKSCKHRTVLEHRFQETFLPSNCPLLTELFPGTNNTRAVGNQAAPCASPSVDGISPCGELVLQDIPPARKRLKSPTKPVKARDRSLIDRQQASDFPARPLAKAKGRLWSEGDPLPTRSRPAPTQTRRCPRYGGPQKPKEDDDSSVKKSIGQPETRSISQEQLVAEVKGIYAGLVMVESKCIEVDSSQRAQNEPETRPKPNNEQWQALIALHRTLLHEHHDFFLASQHPSAPSLGLRGLASRHALIALQRSLLHKHHDFFLASQHPSTTSPKLNNEQCQALTALYRTLLHEHHDFLSQHPSTTSPGLRRLASKYAMPARMWRQGIHSFFDLLHHSPASLEHMLTFIYLAYSMMSLLYETVPHFEDIYKAYSMLALLYETVPGIQDTWIECLGDLGRYRMPIEDEDPLAGDREIWTEVSRYWYSKASDKAPTTGRLYHHLAILARPDAVKQLFYYTKSLCVAIPFKSARDSIRTLLDPIINGPQRDYNVDSMDFPQTARPLPDDWSLRGLPWAESLFPDDWFSGDNDDDDDEGTFRLPSPPLKDTYGRISWGASGGGRCSSPGFYSDPFDDLQRKFHSEAGTMPRCILNPSYLPYTFPQKFLGLAVLTAMAIPIVSAELPGRDVVTMAWAFGIMANVPSVYVLANPPVPSRVDGGAEEVLWKIARGW